jgi:5-methylcytosine-specific restriction endonuclease McrA
VTNAYDSTRGNVTDQQRRREWLLETYRADVDAVTIEYVRSGEAEVWFAKSPRDQQIMIDQLEDDDAFRLISVEFACRCYRCGKLLTLATLTVDRIVPACKGGTYRRTNIRPSCSDCANKQGGELRAENRSNVPVVRPSVPELAARNAPAGCDGTGTVPVPGVQASGQGSVRRDGPLEGGS